MSTTDLHVSRTDTHDSDVYDHAIQLVDSTLPTDSPDNDNASSSSHQKDARWRGIARKPTRSGVKEGLAKRKYAKHQEGREQIQEQSAEPGDPSSTVPEEPSQAEVAEVLPGKIAPVHPVGESDFAARETSEERGRTTAVAEGQPQAASQESKKRKSPTDRGHKKEHAIDVLYENQRGWFVLGIPLYSHSSLLNFDPAAWVTKDFKDSPVNITNAQVPDPAWEWEWKSWYVDMSYDVDEEGWQYSFSFSSRFSWHGTHPWFHSFVRRRRWLRKRVMKHHRIHADAQPGHMSQAHMLTSDYFTIHPERNRSRSADRNTNARYSYISASTAATADDINVPPEDINNVPSLMKALRLATVDREKIDVIRKFVAQGGEELAYLKDSIPDIMSLLVFQNSRRQLVSYLNSAAHEAEHMPASAESADGSHQPRVEHLHSAAEAANKQIGGLEYWSDRKHVLSTTDNLDHNHHHHHQQHDGAADIENRPSTTASKDSKATFISREAHETRIDNPMKQDEIKGIPKAADVGVDHTERFLKMGSGPDGGEDSGRGRAGAGDAADDKVQEKEPDGGHENEDEENRNNKEEEEKAPDTDDEKEGEEDETQPANELLPRDAVRMVQHERDDHDDHRDNEGGANDSAAN